MAAWHPPRCDWTAASGRLPGRVHFSIQSPHLQIPRQTVLSIGSTSRAGRPHPVCRLGQTTTCCVWWRQVNTPILLIGGDKTGNDRWYEENVPIADRIYDAHLAELEK